MSCWLDTYGLAVVADIHELVELSYGSLFYTVDRDTNILFWPWYLPMQNLLTIFHKMYIFGLHSLN